MHMKASDQNLSLNCLKNHVGEFWLDASICILISKSLSLNCLKNTSYISELWFDAFMCIILSKSVGELSYKSCR